MPPWSVLMGRDGKLDELEELLDGLDYPLSRGCDDVTLTLADGEESLGDLVTGSGDETFESMDDLETEVMNLLSQHAVGEPYQSEGDG